MPGSTVGWHMLSGFIVEGWKNICLRGCKLDFFYFSMDINYCFYGSPETCALKDEATQQDIIMLVIPYLLDFLWI